MIMVGTHIDCCVSNYAHAEIIPNVNKSADAQPDYRVTRKGTKISADSSIKAKTFGKLYSSVVHSASEFDLRKFVAAFKA